jgi:hypothetical protein
MACLCLLGLAAFLGSGAPSAAAAECTNEAIRNSASTNLNPTTGQPYSATLPECRAYEKVTPDYKQAADANWKNQPYALDGNAVSWVSSGNYLGEGSTLSNTYRALRTSAGWSTKNANAPQRLLSASTLTQSGFSEDGLSNFWCGERDVTGEGIIWNTPDPFLCAVGDQDSVWTPTPEFTPIDSYANGATGSGTATSAVAASPDLSHIVIKSNRRFLPADTATGTIGTLYELVDPTGPNPILRVVNVDSAGSLIGPSTQPGVGANNLGQRYQAISADGSTIFFTTTPAGGTSTVYARINGATTTAISNPSPPECTTCDPAVKAPAYAGASSDGNRVFFTTAQQLQNADTDTTTDLYEYDFESSTGHHIVQASGGGAGDLTLGSGANVLGVVRVNREATHVYFVATGVLATAPNALGQTATAGASNLYLFERDASFPLGRTRFVASIPTGEVSGITGLSSPSAVTPDGRYLVFQTAAALTPNDLDSATDVYRYDSQTGELIRVSIGEPSYPASSNGNTAGMNAVVEGRALPIIEGASQSRLPISSDGSFVVFGTPEKLQDDDSNGGLTTSTCGGNALHQGCDVYLWHDGAVHLISEGQPVSGVESLSYQGGTLSASGSDVFFTTRNHLVPQDGDGAVDIYDARIDGGFPYVAPTPLCEGNEGCHGSPPPAPASNQAASSTFSGPGNDPIPSVTHKKRHKKKNKKHAQSRKHTTSRRHG